VIAAGTMCTSERTSGRCPRQHEGGHHDRCQDDEPFHEHALPNVDE
jgi:hypothetical protein